MTHQGLFPNLRRRMFAVTICLAMILAASRSSADAPPACPPKQMLSVIREASRMYLIRLGRRESHTDDPLDEAGRFLGFDRLHVTELEAARIKPLIRVFEKPESYACGDRSPAKRLTIPPVQIGFVFDSERGRVNLVLLEPEQRVQMEFSNGAYAESPLSERGASAWNEAIETVLAPGQAAKDFYDAMRATRPTAPAPAAIVTPGAPPEAVVDDSCLHAPEQDLEAVKKVPPEYPELGRQNGVEGLVQVRALVGPDGRVLITRIVTSVPMLDEAAAAAVRQWRFEPAIRNGVPACAWTTVPVKFSLH